MALGPAGAAPAGLGARTDPLLAHRFAVEIDGVIVGGFAEATGLGVELETFDYREGGVNEFVHRLPGPARSPANLILRRGFAASDVLWRWQDDAARGRIQRRNGALVILDRGSEAMRFSFVGGYPVRWTGPDLRAGSATAALESLEIAHRGLTLRRAGAR
jgi:phage tail-like protein